MLNKVKEDYYNLQQLGEIKFISGFIINNKNFNTMIYSLKIHNKIRLKSHKLSHATFFSINKIHIFYVEQQKASLLS
jgi:hypothetical protein